MKVKVSMKNGRTCGLGRKWGKREQVRFSIEATGMSTLEKEAVFRAK